MTSSWASTQWTTRAIQTAARNTSRPSRPWPTWPPRLRWRGAASPFTRRSSTSPRRRSSGAAPPWGSITPKPFPATRPMTKAAPVAIARPVACAAKASRPPSSRTPHATRHPQADLLPGAMDAALPDPATIAWLAFGLGTLFGAATRHTRFCTLGAMADVILMADWGRMRMWGLATAVALLGTTALQTAGLIDIGKSIYTGGRLLWLSHLAGGLLFGVGMTLASGCGARTLVRIGGGNLKSLVVALVLGVSAYMSLRGLFAVGRASWLDTVAWDMGTTQALPFLLGSPVQARTIAFGCGALLLTACLAGRSAWRGEVLVGGLTVGACVVAGWYVTGHLGHVAEHPTTLEEAFIATNSGRPESLTFVAPYAYTLELLILWSDSSRIVTFGIASALGVVAGSAVHALAPRSFRLEGFRDPTDLLRHLAGGICMGFGGVTALGCTIGQGITGLSTLALGSLLTTASTIVGATLTLPLGARIVDRTCPAPYLDRVRGGQYNRPSLSGVVSS